MSVFTALRPLALPIICALGLLLSACQDNARAPNTPASADEAFGNYLNYVPIQDEGTLIKQLPDDTKGSSHQRLILQFENNLTMLLVHNIDVAPRIEGLQKGDRIAFLGEYIWSKKGGTIHWTHRSNTPKHAHGWVRHKGKQYD